VPERVVEVRQPGRAVLRVLVTEPLDVGRDCDGLLLADEKASRRHARLTPSASGVTVEDLGSRNGTWVNGVRSSGPAIVTEQDSLVIGDTLFVVLAPAARAGGETFAAGELDPRSSIAAVLIAVEHAGAEREAAARPGGTVTIMFSDIESSTAITERLGDERWLVVLREHNALVRSSLTRHGGTEVKTIGDGFMVTFASARSGLDCAVAIQRDLAGRRGDGDWPVRVRIGLHAGEVLREGDDVFGTHVNTAARVAGAAEGGEILASGLVHDLVRPVTRVVFGPPRDLSLKGLEGVHRVHPVLWGDGA
jgi:class 3 adenylate cyclase